MSPGRYKFANIFTYDPTNGIIVPRFDVIINGWKLNQGATINRYTFIGGLDLFNYIGKDMAGTWDAKNRVVTIQGFY